MHIENTPVWTQLLAHQKTWNDQHLKTLFAEDPQRFANFSVETNGLLFDYSKQKVSRKTLELLFELANTVDLKGAIEALFAGAHVNNTEDRPALHMSLRHPEPGEEVAKVLSKMEKLVQGLHDNSLVSATGKPIRHVISIGIGGSDLGPRMVCHALENQKQSKQMIHFIANVDGEKLESLLNRIQPDETMVIINSKTFSTIETIHNAEVIRDWMQAYHPDAYAKQAYAVTASPSKAKAQGLSEKNTFQFWDWVGGRYSVWSAVGLPIAIQVGMDGFRQFLMGAYAMDQHFQNAPWSENIPVLMGLIGVWNRNFWQMSSQAIIPYGDALQEFPAYLQQLEMESNGKAVGKDGKKLQQPSQPVIWGGVGCNGQHAYMQLLHQGTEDIPIDFILAAKTASCLRTHHDLLVASCLGQSQALMLGRETVAMNAEDDDFLSMAKMCPGNRPSTTIVVDRFSAFQLGQLIALYEHKVYVQGVLWGVQSFDQWGVELGKQLIKDILPAVGGEIPEAWDSSTRGLLAYIQNNR